MATDRKPGRDTPADSRVDDVDAGMPGHAAQARLHRIVILIALSLTLAVAIMAVAGRERLLAHGDTLFLRLAPVDPRSLMQGDYMALNFAVGNDLLASRAHADAAAPARGDAEAEFSASPVPREQVVVVRVDSRGEATFARLHGGEALAPGEHLLRVQNVRTRWGGPQVQVSTDAYFFQEGQAERYATARYGEFRVDAAGQALLVGLRDDALAPLGALSSGAGRHVRPGTPSGAGSDAGR